MALYRRILFDTAKLPDLCAGNRTYHQPRLFSWRLCRKNVQEDLYFSISGGEVNLEQAEVQANAVIEAYPSVDVSLSDTATLRLLGQTEKVNIPAIIEGRELKSPGEILLDPAFAKSNGYLLGSTIDMGGQSFSVVGYTALPQYIYPLQGVNDLLAVPASFGISVISHEDFRYFAGVEQNYSVRFRDRAASPNEQAMRLRDYLQDEELPVSDWIAASNNKRISLVETSVTSYQAMSLPLSLSMILLSCLIVGIMTWRMIKREGVVIGTLYAFGYRRRELVRHYMAIPMLLALVGGISGALLGVPCVKPSVDVMVQSYLIPVPQIIFNFTDIIVSIIMPVVALGISSYFVVNSVLKHPAAELMKGNQDSGKVSRLDKLFKLERLRFNTKFKLREQFRVCLASYSWFWV
ncbi:ABC transporter permease [Eubacteriales bacterium OttesenSCG-928-K08]|nr:ABC transporter permease [Eubacteriales bacterium OttesenSCG-928-K08]